MLPTVLDFQGIIQHFQLRSLRNHIFLNSVDNIFYSYKKFLVKNRWKWNLRDKIYSAKWSLGRVESSKSIWYVFAGHTNSQSVKEVEREREKVQSIQSSWYLFLMVAHYLCKQTSTILRSPYKHNIAYYSCTYCYTYDRVLACRCAVYVLYIVVHKTSQQPNEQKYRTRKNESFFFSSSAAPATEAALCCMLFVRKG